ncbi:MAG: S8 family serine peptidase, partial [Caldilineaceae bacterium]|nr:S8 family serine peptidase [Caldilineaceae bacterium]
VAAGIYYAVDNGARVINLSLGASATSRTIQDAVDYAEEHDVIVVASSGNAASSLPYYPAAIPWVVAV